MTDRDFQEFMIKHMTELSGEVKELRQSQARMEFKFTEKIDALFDGYQVINEKLDEHTAILNNHSMTLDEHTAILNNHSMILDEHTAILNKQSMVLDEHTERLQRIENKVEKHDIQIRVLDETKTNKRKIK